MDNAHAAAVSRILYQLDALGNRNLSSSSDSDHCPDRDRCRVEVLEVSTIFDHCDIQETDSMHIHSWSRFCDSIKSRVDPTLSEVEGIHPVLQELVRGCMGRSHRDLQLIYEGRIESENRIIKKPTMSVVVNNLRNKFGAVIATVAIPIVATKLGGRQRAIAQALGHLALRLKTQAPTVDPYNYTLSGFAIGFDGQYVVIGHIEIIALQVVIRQSEKLLMWPVSGDAPRYTFLCLFNIFGTLESHLCFPCALSTETEGVRALRTLFSATASQLGMEPPTLILPGNIVLQHMLGEGSFGMAFAAHDVRNSNDVFVVKVPHYPIATEQETHDAVNGMVTEWQHLRQLATDSPSPYLPTLRDIHTPPTAERLMILMEPVGIPLAVYVAPMTRADRILFAERMEQHLHSALRHALAQNLCHTDIRPDQVVVHQGRAVLIDWGLARAPGSPVHHCRGGVPFCDDQLVLYYDRVVNRLKKNPPVPVLYHLPDFDLAAVRIVTAIVKHGYERLSPPWGPGAGVSGPELVTLRDQELRKPF